MEPRRNRGRPPRPGIDARTRATRALRIQAQIAACHGPAAQPEDTDWAAITRLYAELAALTPSPVVELDRAVAVGMADGPAAGLAIADDLAAGGQLAGYHLLPAVRADLLRRLDRPAEAAQAYRAAMEQAGTDTERHYLKRRLTEITGSPDSHSGWGWRSPGQRFVWGDDAEHGDLAGRGEPVQERQRFLLPVNVIRAAAPLGWGRHEPRPVRGRRSGRVRTATSGRGARPSASVGSPEAASGGRRHSRRRAGHAPVPWPFVPLWLRRLPRVPWPGLARVVALDGRHDNSVKRCGRPAIVFTSAAMPCPAAWSIVMDAENPPVPPLWKSSPSTMIQASPPADWPSIRTRGCWHSLIAVPSGPSGGARHTAR